MIPYVSNAFFPIHALLLFFPNLGLQPSLAFPFLLNETFNGFLKNFPVELNRMSADVLRMKNHTPASQNGVGQTLRRLLIKKHAGDAIDDSFELSPSSKSNHGFA